MSSTHQNPKTLAIHEVDVFGMCCHLRSCCYYNTTGSGLWEFNQINGDAVLERWPRDTCPEQGVTWSLAEELCSLMREAERSRELCTLFAAFQDLFVMQKEGFLHKSWGCCHRKVQVASVLRHLGAFCLVLAHSLPWHLEWQELGIARKKLPKTLFVCRVGIKTCMSFSPICNLNFSI